MWPMPAIMVAARIHEISRFRLMARFLRPMHEVPWHISATISWKEHFIIRLICHQAPYPCPATFTFFKPRAPLIRPHPLYEVCHVLLLLIQC